MDLYAQIAGKIIKQQESIIGPVAVEQAESVDGLEVDWAKQTVTIKGDGKKIIESLVERYKDLFGQISVEVCKEASSKLISQLADTEQPESLR